MATIAPAPVDCQILQFKQLCRIKTCSDRSKSLYRNPTQLLATSSLYGLTFVGERCGLKVIVTGKIFENNFVELNPKNVVKCYLHRNIHLPSAPSHIDVNADQHLLCIAFIKNEMPFLRIYEIRTLFARDPTVFSEVRLSLSSNTFVMDLTWNPVIPNMLTCCISDRTLSVYTFSSNGSFEIKSLSTESNSMCVCWSPKGKQLVVGNYNGFLTQYLPDLKQVKHYLPPSNIFDKPCTLCSIKWLSSFQFIGVYKLQTPSEDDDDKTSVIIINTSKNEPVTYINYEDICFSSGTERPCQFYFIHIPAWNLIFAASSNAVEVSVLKQNQDGINWCQWMLEDSARITLPMSGVNETFPVGIAIDYSSPMHTSIGDNVVPMPIISVLTCEGLICVYVINYLDRSVANICVKSNLEPELQFFSTCDVTSEDDKANAMKTSTPLTITATPSSQSSNILENPTTTMIMSSPIQIQNFESQAPSKVSASPSLLGANGNVANLSRLTNFTSSPSTVVSRNHNVATSSMIPATVVQKIDITTTSTVASAIPTSASKTTVQARDRLEFLKKFKKMSSTFDNDVQEIKGLIENISVEDAGAAELNVRLKTLESDAKQLIKLKSDLSNEVDSIKISLIEVFACIQDIKTKYFQITNPGYRTLLGAQDLDPVNATSLKNIENNLNYIEGQLEKANQQLDDFWTKYTDHSSQSPMKVPILDSVFETMIKQQKIFKILQSQTEKIEKKISAVKCQLKSSRWMRGENERNFSSNHLYEDQNLADFAKNALRIKDDYYVDPKLTLESTKKLAHQYSLEHAKRFHISNEKRLKLQELHSGVSITYVQSSRLQRLKKKSLILLSKSAYSDESPEDDIIVAETIHKNEESHANFISPVSSVEDITSDRVSVLEYPTVPNVVSSTPVKSADSHVLPRFGVDSSIAPEFSTSDKTVIVQTPKSGAESVFASATITLPINRKPKIPLPIVNSFAPLGTAVSTSSTLAPMQSSSSPTPVISSAPEVTASFSLLKNFTANTIAPSSSNISKPLFSVEISNSAVSAAGHNATVVSTTPVSLLFAKTSTTSSASTTPASESHFGTTLSSSSAIVSSLSNATMPSASLPIASATSPSVTGVAPAVPVSLFSGSKLGANGSGLFGSNAVAPNSTPVNTTNASKTNTFSLFGNINAGGTGASFLGGLKAASTSTGVTISPVTSSGTTSSGPSTMFGGTGSIFGKAGSLAGTINFGSTLPHTSSVFGSKTVSAADSVSADKKTSAFSTFNFASKLDENTSVTVTEIPADSVNNDGSDADKENKSTSVSSAASSNSTAASSFTFSSFNATGFAPVKTSLFSMPSTSLPTTTAVGFVSPAPTPVTAVSTAALSAGNSLLANILSSTSPAPTVTTNSSGMLKMTPITENAIPASVIVSSTVVTPPAATVPANDITPAALEPVTPVASPTPVITTPTTTNIVTSNAAPPFENKSSFFEGLSLGATTTTASSIFAKSPSATSVFGGNLFAQNATTSASAATTGDTKSIFGGTLMFETNNVSSGESPNLFGSASAGGFAENQSSVFGSSSLFGSGSFGGNAAVSPQSSNAFSSSSGGMLFSGSNAGGFSSSNSLFQNTAGGFGSPPTFGSTVQPSQTAGGFSSPPSFSSVFNKSPSSFSAFGAAPTFGGSPAFGGSPTKVFGQTTNNQATFGSTAGQQPTAFENLATENTMSFGNLAQQQGSSFGSPTSFGGTNQQTSFGQSNFGGNSFSSWR